MKYVAIYRAPQSVMEDWMKLPQEERDAQQKKMEADWDVWTQKNAAAIKESAGLGKNVQATAAGAAAVNNDLMMFTIVEAETPEEAAEIFKGHPHFAIPQATIDIMPYNVIPGM